MLLPVPLHHLKWLLCTHLTMPRSPSSHSMRWRVRAVHAGAPLGQAKGLVPCELHPAWFDPCIRGITYAWGRVWLSAVALDTLRNRACDSACPSCPCRHIHIVKKSNEFYSSKAPVATSRPCRHFLTGNKLNDCVASHGRPSCAHVAKSATHTCVW